MSGIGNGRNTMSCRPIWAKCFPKLHASTVPLRNSSVNKQKETILNDHVQLVKSEWFALKQSAFLPTLIPEEAYFSRKCVEKRKYREETSKLSRSPTFAIFSVNLANLRNRRKVFDVLLVHETLDDLIIWSNVIEKLKFKVSFEDTRRRNCISCWQLSDCGFCHMVVRQNPQSLSCQANTSRRRHLVVSDRRRIF